METSKPNILNTILSKIKVWWNNTWKSPKEAFYLLFVILVLVMAVVVVGTTLQGGFFHFNTDDIIQYYPFVGGLIEKIKQGQLSIYDTTLFGGTSFFAGVYYLPFDVFTLLTLILSVIMEAETAYSLCNFLRPLAGSLLLFYVLSRKGMKPKTCFIIGLIYFVGGMTQAYYVFPVYLGINFYAPLAMLLCDLCIEKKGKWYLLLPLYSFIVILYDFYLAYMLLAFLVIYFLAEMHKKDIYTFFGKNTFVKNKAFWINFGKCFGLVILGVGLASFMMIPSIQYVLTESSRNNSNADQSLWYFTSYDYELKEYVFSMRHYFTMWCNFFIPNEPHRFMLQQAGDYVKEHASFYLTCGGLVYLVYFFTVNKKEFNRMKFWVVLLNVMFLMPICSMVFTANAQPYVRWFFIPYMFNLYATSMIIDESDFAFGDKKWKQFLPVAVMLCGLITLVYVIIKDPDTFIHYDKNDYFFYPILAISIGVVCIYLIIYLTSAILNLKNKNYPLFRKVIPFIISGECLFACVLIFCNLDNTSKGYYDNKEVMTEMKDTLYNFGYKDESGYRINIYDNSAKATANSNSLIGNVNFGRFFQSFYNTPLNQCLGDIFRETSTSWSRNFIGGYNLLSSNIFTNKYIVAYTPQGIHFPSEYYHVLGTKGNYTYYELKDMPQFIVYDKAFYKVSSTTLAKREEAILKYAYVNNPEIPNVNDLDPELNKDQIEKYYQYQNFVNTGIDIVLPKQVDTSLKGNHKSTSLNSNGIEVVNGNNYFWYDISGLSVINNDVLEVFPLSSKIRDITYEDLFIRDTNGNDHGMHYNTAYLEDHWTPSKLYIRTESESESSYVDLYGYDYEAYESFIEEQETYLNKSFRIENGKMYITCKMPTSDKVRIIKTPYTYSADWVCDKFETINVNGGFLGIVIPKGFVDVDLIVKYEPKGFSMGCKIAAVSCIIYAGIATPTIVVFIRKRKEKNEKNIDNSSVL